MWKTLRSLFAEILPGWIKARAIKKQEARQVRNGMASPEPRPGYRQDSPR